MPRTHADNVIKPVKEGIVDETKSFDPSKSNAYLPPLTTQSSLVMLVSVPQLLLRKSQIFVPPNAGLSDGQSQQESGNKRGNIASDAERAKPECTDVLSQVTTLPPCQQAEPE
jgi:hypothetical protein